MKGPETCLVGFCVSAVVLRLDHHLTGGGGWIAVVASLLTVLFSAATVWLWIKFHRQSVLKVEALSLAEPAWRPGDRPLSNFDWKAEDVVGGVFVYPLKANRPGQEILHVSPGHGINLDSLCVVTNIISGEIIIVFKDRKMDVCLNLIVEWLCRQQFVPARVEHVVKVLRRHRESVEKVFSRKRVGP